MHRFLTTTLLMTVCCACAYCQVPNYFNQTYPDGRGFPAIAAKQSPDGFRIVSNSSPTAPGFQSVEIQTDEMGNQLTYLADELVNTSLDFGLRLSDGNYVFAGRTPDHQATLTKKSADGSVIWSQAYTLPNNNSVEVGQVVEQEDGTLFLFGLTPQAVGAPPISIYALKVLPDGSLAWAQLLQPGGGYIWASIDFGAATSDGGLVVSSHSGYSQNGYNYLHRFDGNGNVLLNQQTICCHLQPALRKHTAAVGGAGGKTCVAYHREYDASDFEDVYLLQYGEAGGPEDWTTRIVPYPALPSSPSAVMDLEMNALASTSDGHYLVAGNAAVSSEGVGHSGFFMAKLSQAGTLAWIKFDYGFMASPRFLTELNDGRILVGGLKDGETWLMATSSQGKLSCNDTSAISIALCQAEASPLTGTVYPDAGSYTEQVVFTNAQGCDSLVNASVTVHPEELIWADNGPLPYGMVYHGVVLTQDTQFILFDTTEFGCLLTISENVTVSPSATSELGQMLNLRVFPNPTSGGFFVEMDLPEAQAINLEAIDPLGRRVAGSPENGFYQSGKQKLHLDASQWPSGVYLLRFQLGNASFYRRISVE